MTSANLGCLRILIFQTTHLRGPLCLDLWTFIRGGWWSRRILGRDIRDAQQVNDLRNKSRQVIKCVNVSMTCAMDGGCSRKAIKHCDRVESRANVELKHKIDGSEKCTKTETFLIDV